jgi:hypothetical protein
LADAIESIGFECTLCGVCCKAVETHDGNRDEHTAPVFLDWGTPPRMPSGSPTTGGTSPGRWVPLSTARARKRAHESKGLGRGSDRRDAEEVADPLQERTVRELEETIAVREAHESRPEADGVVVHDPEGPKRPDGTPLDGR